MIFARQMVVDRNGSSIVFGDSQSRRSVDVQRVGKVDVFPMFPLFINRQRDESDRIISDLDSQTQELERKLRDSEEQARSLADENARLAEAANGGAQF